MKKIFLFMMIFCSIAVFGQITVWGHVDVWNTDYTQPHDTAIILAQYDIQEIDSILFRKPHFPLRPEYPRVQTYEDSIAIVWHLIDAEVCGDLVLAGSYNGWITDTNALAKFKPIPEFPSWYVTYVHPDEIYTNDHALEAKPCMLNPQGEFNWIYQWANNLKNVCSILYGDAYIMIEYEVEPKLIVNYNETLVYIESSDFKENPCK